MIKLLFAIFLPTLCPLFAQNVALPITIGYTEPAPFQVAPGQVLTLFLDNISFGQRRYSPFRRSGSGRPAAEPRRHLRPDHYPRRD